MGGRVERYKNLGGNSGVTKYEIGTDSIIVEFGDGGTYLYNHQKPGASDVNHMKKLARSGQGLNNFINTNVRKNYAKKLR